MKEKEMVKMELPSLIKDNLNLIFWNDSFSSLTSYFIFLEYKEFLSSNKNKFKRRLFILKIIRILYSFFKIKIQNMHQYFILHLFILLYYL